MIVVLVGGVVGIRMFGAPREGGVDIPARVSPTQAPVYKDVTGVDVILKPNATNTQMSLTLSGLDGRFTGIEYELHYDTDKGPKGALSGGKPIAMSAGQDSFTREITLGTCSTGGKCTHDKGVKNFKIFVKLHTSDGTVEILKKEFDAI